MVDVNRVSNNVNGVGYGFIPSLGVNYHAGKVQYTDKHTKPDYFAREQKQLPQATVATYPGVTQYSSKQLLRAYSNTNFVNFLINSNPELKETLMNSELDWSICPKNILSIMNTHLTTTTAYAMQMANNLGLSAADKKVLEQACVFHDFGKILIPEEIINKHGSLTKEERKIINMHAELGAQLLKNSGLNKKVLNLIENHHNSSADSDVLCQILSVADIYSALREERSYKGSMSEGDAFNILDQKADNGEVSTEVVNALRKAVAYSEYAA